MTRMGIRVRVGTYNIHSAVGMDRRYDPRRIARVIQEVDPDIIGLQEVSSRPDLLGVSDQFEYFEQEIGFFGAHGPNVVLQDSRYGNALLTRWPIIETRLIDLAIEKYEPRGAIDADIEVAGRVVRVIVTHLGLRRRERRLQYVELVRLLERGPVRPTVIMGDFNSWWPDIGCLGRLGARRGREWAPATFPSLLPCLTLDRIVVWPQAILDRVWKHQTRLSRIASDHLPLVGELCLDNL